METGEILFGVFVVVNLIGGVAWQYWNRVEPVADGSCLGCDDPTGVRWIADGVYECDRCGHTGGDRLAEHLETKRRAAMDQWPDAKRAQHVRRCVTEGIQALESAHVTLRQGGVATFLADIAAEGEDASDRIYFQGAAQAEEGLALLRDAAYLRSDLPELRLSFIEPEGPMGATPDLIVMGHHIEGTAEYANFVGVADIRAAAGATDELRAELQAWADRELSPSRHPQ